MEHSYFIGLLKALPFFSLAIGMPFVAGTIAKNYGHNYWLWFVLSIPLPFIAQFILLALPDKSKKVENVEQQVQAK